MSKMCRPDACCTQCRRDACATLGDSVKISAMKKRTIFFLFCFMVPFLVFAQSKEEEPVEKTGGIFPTEAQGEDTNTIPPDRTDAIKAGQLARPQFTNELKIAAQKQDEIRPNYYVMEGYVDLNYQEFRLQADHAEYDAKTKDLIATGNVVLD